MIIVFAFLSLPNTMDFLPVLMGPEFEERGNFQTMQLAPSSGGRIRLLKRQYENLNRVRAIEMNLTKELDDPMDQGLIGWIGRLTK